MIKFLILGIESIVFKIKLTHQDTILQYKRYVKLLILLFLDKMILIYQLTSVIWVVATARGLPKRVRQLESMQP
jgi:hypothetical protein